MARGVKNLCKTNMGDQRLGRDLDGFTKAIEGARVEGIRAVLLPALLTTDASWRVFRTRDKSTIPTPCKREFVNNYFAS